MTENWPRGTQKLATITNNRPMEHSLDQICPFCNSKEIKEIDHYMTLVGGDPDPNHHWRTFKCRECDKKFIYQHKREYGWITDENNLCVEGIHACFESVEYKCSKCDTGKVKQEHRETNGISILTGSLLTTFNEYGKINHYRTFWKCDTCGNEVEQYEM